MRQRPVALNGVEAGKVTRKKPANCDTRESACFYRINTR